MDSDILYLDQRGYEQYLESIDKAENELKEIQKYKGEVAIYQGDNWHDNPALYQTEMNERMAIRKLHDLKADLAKIRIIDEHELNEGIHVNNIITLLLNFGASSREIRVKLIAATPSNNAEEISVNSPLGAAILGKKANDVVSYVINKNQISAQILEIE